MISGVTHPERWPNLWVSDPAQPLPQWLQLTLSEPTMVSEVHVILDTDTSLSYIRRPPFHRPPQCARDFHLEARIDGEWQTVAEVKGNYQRRRVLAFEPVKTDALRLVIEATNGGPSARVYGVRVEGP